ncbi:hypothetical protein PspLS_11311 [Pyricularia sp. CBS 133598]|nr:hypothetical protein PspLS_11311 [Pyricularia sp. CBS 133598]
MAESEAILIGVLVPFVAIGLIVLGLLFLAHQKATAGRVSDIYIVSRVMAVWLSTRTRLANDGLDFE